MIDIIVLSFVLSSEPMKCRKTDEEDQVVCFNSNPTEDAIVANVDMNIQYATVTSNSEQTVVSVTDFSRKEDFPLLAVDKRFRQLAAQWSAETSHISSVTRTISHPNYQAIIKLGWEVVPLMLQDLQKGKGFWYPALNAITGIRPFDPKDAGNSKRMTQAWINWGHKKGLI